MNDVPGVRQSRAAGFPKVSAASFGGSRVAEERSKAEILSALRCRDETKSFCQKIQVESSFS